jgi:zinc protease
VATIRARDGTYNFTRNLGEAIASSHWKKFLTYIDDVKAVTAADVKRVAELYLHPDRATVGWFIPTRDVRRVDLATPASVKLPAATGKDGPAAAVKSAERKGFAQRTTRKVLANGLIVDVVENRAVPTVAVRGVAFAGDVTAPAGKRALPALTAKMLSRGTTVRTKEQIGAALDDVGATRTYGAGLTEAAISANGMARDLPLLLEILAEEIRRPAFRADEVEKARKELENDYLRADDNTSQRAMERLGQLVYAKEHPYYSMGREDKLASLKAVTEADLRDYHRARYVGAGMILAIVGDVDAAKTMAMVEKLFGDLPRGERPSFAKLARVTPLATGAREVVRMPGKANMNLVFGTASGLRRSDPEFEAALVANAALGQTALSSRLGRRVRDTEGLTYQIFSRYLNSEELDGYWLANVNVAPQNLAKAMKSTREVIEQFAREGVNDAEVEAQKSFFAGNYQVNLGSNAGIAAALVQAEKFGYGPRYLDEYPNRIRAVTTAQANAALKKYFFADKLHVVVAGDLEKLPE